MAGPTSASISAPEAAAAWAASGMGALSGPPPGRRLGPPAPLVQQVLGRGRRMTATAASWGRDLEADWLALLGERAALEGLRAAGRASCGGAARLLRCEDNWVGVSLARPSDVDLVPAWLALAGDGRPWRPPGPAAAPSEPTWRTPESFWRSLGARVRSRRGARLSAAAEVLGLPVGVLGERRAAPDGGVRLHDAAASGDGGPPRRVVDLSTLWAGPLCASLLGRCATDVLKVSSRNRPDGAATGDAAWDRLLNGTKVHVELALDTATGRAQLADLLAEADVVVESARPRALEQMGIFAAEVMALPNGPRAWVSITGHGRSSARVAFGDDAAVAGGLVVSNADGPWFCGDAVADPLSGIAAADAALRCLADRRRAIVEVSMAGVAAAHAGPTLPNTPEGATGGRKADPRTAM